MNRDLKESYERAKMNARGWFAYAQEAGDPHCKKQNAFECLGFIGSAAMLAGIAEKIFNENLKEELREMEQMKERVLHEILEVEI